MSSRFNDKAPKHPHHVKDGPGTWFMGLQPSPASVYMAVHYYKGPDSKERAELMEHWIGGKHGEEVAIRTAKRVLRDRAAAGFKTKPHRIQVIERVPGGHEIDIWWND